MRTRLCVQCVGICRVVEVRFSEFVDRYVNMMKRDYTVGGRVWHAKSICYCRKKTLEQPFEEVARSDPVMVGQLVHLGVDYITGYEPEVYVCNIKDYVLKGTPDLYMDDELVEVKFTVYPPKEPREHDALQLRIYMNMLGLDKAYMWYISPFGSKEFEVTGALSDSEIVDLIENPRVPFWDFECKYCKVYDCAARRL